MVGVCLVGVLPEVLIPCLRELGRTAGFLVGVVLLTFGLREVACLAGFLVGVRVGVLDLTLASAVFAFLGCLLGVEPEPDVSPFLLPVAFGAFLTEEE